MSSKRIIYLGLFGLGLTITGLILLFYGFPFIIQFQIQKKLELKNGSEMYPMWQKLSFPLTFNTYIFNVTNPTGVNQGDKPILKEVGPFCYNLFREKIILNVSDDKNFIIYDSRRLFYEKADLNCVSSETELTILNFALLATVHIMLDLLPDFLTTFDETIPLMYPGIKTIFIKAKAKDILFNGLLLDCSNPDSTLGLVCQNVESMSPPQVWKHSNGKDYLFAALKYMNDSSEGIFQVNTGISDLRKLGELTAVNGEKQLHYWLTDKCNQLGGTDGYISPPIQNQSEINVFQVDVCRSLKLKFESEMDMLDLPVRKYITTDSIFETSDTNNCYCTKRTDPETEEKQIKCLKSGVINLSPCFKAPVILSWPHFYLADDEYKNYVHGLTPNKSIHENFVAIQPELCSSIEVLLQWSADEAHTILFFINVTYFAFQLTGVPVKGFKRAQINMFLIKSEDISVLNNVSEGLFPIFWIEEGAEIPDTYQKLLKIVMLLLKIVNIVEVAWLIVGILCILFALILYIKRRELFCFTKDNQVHELLSETTLNEFRRSDDWQDIYSPLRHQKQQNFQYQNNNFQLEALPQTYFNNNISNNFLSKHPTTLNSNNVYNIKNDN